MVRRRTDNPAGKLRFKEHDVRLTLLRQARKEGNIVFGGQAIKKRLGILARRTKDFDFFSRTSRKSALKAEMNLNRVFRDNVFFTKKGTNPGTFKVKHKGNDLLPNTNDDIGVADFTLTPRPPPKFFVSKGVRFRTLREELNAKKRLVKNKEFLFRREKDLEDLRRIIRSGRL